MPTPIDRRISAGHLSYRFDAALPPAWRVRPGEWIEAEVPDGMAGTIQRPDDLYRAVDPDHVNPVVGPIYVEGAEATDTLGVELREIRVDAPQGYVLIIPGFGLLRDRYPGRAHADLPGRGRGGPVRRGAAAAARPVHRHDRRGAGGTRDQHHHAGRPRGQSRHDRHPAGRDRVLSGERARGACSASAIPRA